MDINKMCPGCMQEVEDRDNVETCPHCSCNLGQIKSEPHQMQPFTILAGKYLIGRVIGEGGFGIFYIGLDLNLELVVAIKEFYPNGFVTRESNVTTMVSMYAGKNEADVEKWREGFINEARNLAKFSNLNGIVEVRDFFNENSTAYIVMEYIDGITLKQYLKQNGGKLSADQTFEMMEPVIRSMSKVHDAGMIHRDISPDNIMITKYGGMKLLDFGAAREFAGNAEKSLSIMLKPGYAPEEQYRSRGKQGPWSDVYALTATIYKCITGVTPVESMERMREDTLKPPKELGVSISDVQNAAVMQGMAVYAENRIQNMDALHTALYSDKSVMTAADPPEVRTEGGQPQPGTVVNTQDRDIRLPSIKLPSTDGIDQKTILIGSAAVCGIVLIILCAVLVPSKKTGQDHPAAEIAQSPKTADVMAQTAVPETLPEQEAPAVSETVSISVEEPAAEIATEEDQTVVHRYELITEDVTWPQAFYNCTVRGGYLAHIESQEEFDVIASQILAEDKSKYSFWIGANRSLSSNEYYWVNQDGTYSEETIPSDFWLPGEPTFTGNGDEGVLYDEDSIMMFYRKSEDCFYWNDAPCDIIGAAGYYQGRVGYICEYED